MTERFELPIRSLIGFWIIAKKLLKFLRQQPMTLLARDFSAKDRCFSIPSLGDRNGPECLLAGEEALTVSLPTAPFIATRKTGNCWGRDFEADTESSLFSGKRFQEGYRARGDELSSR